MQGGPASSKRVSFIPTSLSAYKDDGAQGRNRTADTAIFSRMLYQLSYLGLGRFA